MECSLSSRLATCQEKHNVSHDNSKLIECVLHFIQHITSDLNVMAGFLWIEPTVHYVCLLHCCVTAVFSTAGAQVGNKTAPACV